MAKKKAKKKPAKKRAKKKKTKANPKKRATSAERAAVRARASVTVCRNLGNAISSLEAAEKDLRTMGVSGQVPEASPRGATQVGEPDFELRRRLERYGARLLRARTETPAAERCARRAERQHIEAAVYQPGKRARRNGAARGDGAQCIAGRKLAKEHAHAGRLNLIGEPAVEVLAAVAAQARASVTSNHGRRSDSNRRPVAGLLPMRA